MKSLEQRFAEGDERVMNEVYDRFAGPMRAVAFRVLGDRELAADAVQQALVQAWRGSVGYDPGRPLAAWLFAITRRAAFGVYRADRDRGRVVSLDVAGLELHSSVDDDQERVWVAWKVRSAVRALPAADQAVVRLAFLQGLTHREVAEQLGIPVGTVKSRLFRAQRKLAELLAPLRAEDAEPSVACRESRRPSDTACSNSASPIRTPSAVTVLAKCSDTPVKIDDVGAGGSPPTRTAASRSKPTVVNRSTTPRRPMASGMSPWTPASA